MAILFTPPITDDATRRQFLAGMAAGRLLTGGGDQSRAAPAGGLAPGGPTGPQHVRRVTKAATTVRRAAQGWARSSPGSRRRRG